ncbi:MAG: NAD(P)H-dependent glycerol-3-phosphate dehydrogenase [Clostridia bacterium]|jgi:glycerol-3-phosphate dehydrogenase (NAD(P)+)|nr:NAD(P)H-dependent glycerol-3-phosphate dehydrogenase [Clostridia bacterium]MDD4571028.1 NAD(P)H-dependent glycerol-3-phosphate dehydrogenase [Clostridia bacterium]
MRVTVLGAGSWGTALAVLLHKNGHKVKLWSHEEEQIIPIVKEHENKRFLPGITIPEVIGCTADLFEAVKGVKAIVLAVPSQAVRSVAANLKGKVDDNVILINVAKGFENGTLMRMSEVIREELPFNTVTVLSGPSHAEEVALGLPTTVVATAYNPDMAEWTQDLFINDDFRVYTNDDMLGVEVAGALKNIIALGCGISAGLGLGDNSQAAILTRGLAEIIRLGKAMGAKEATFGGLAGIGDLVVTCGSKHSRNRRAGIMLGEGKSLDYVLEHMGMVVEGVSATQNGYALAKKYKVDMPITEGIYHILYDGVEPKAAMRELMTRTKTGEHIPR